MSRLPHISYLYIPNVKTEAPEWRLVPEDWNGSRIHITDDVIIYATIGKTNNYYESYLIKKFVSIDGGLTSYEDFDSYTFPKDHPEVYKVLKKAIDDKRNAHQKERNKRLSKKRKDANEKEAAKLGISVEELMEKRREERKEKKRRKNILRDVKEMNKRAELAAELVGISDTIDSILKKIREDEDVNLNYIQNTIQKISSFKGTLKHILNSK